MPQSAGQIGKTVITTAAGDVKVFGDWVSKFIVAYPKVAVVIAGALGVLAGRFL